MNIHEIIHAWENNALPEDLAALAAIESKLDDYTAAAVAGEEKAQTPRVKVFYRLQIALYEVISLTVTIKIDLGIIEVSYELAEGAVAR
ncbi:MAG: hypothetical protein JWM28_4493 [Chitinophagaceae bacterium]|nr:hypothetical protein [Chitinophagaceae bacterium]